MTRRPGDLTPEPPGGRAAERLREFLDQRFPEGLCPEGSPSDEAREGAVKRRDDAGKKRKIDKGERKATPPTKKR
jgi:hypothetical protein